MLNTCFRDYPDRRSIRDLLDLHNFNQYPAAGQYPLRPSLQTVEMYPEAMRARRSIWVQWIAAQGWPVPPELHKTATKDETQKLYDARVTEAHVPTVAEDRQWAKNQGLSQRQVAALRQNNPDTRLHTKHRR